MTKVASGRLSDPAGRNASEARASLDGRTALCLHERLSTPMVRLPRASAPTRELARLAGNWTGKIEYLHMDFGSASTAAVDPANATPIALGINTRITDDILWV